MLYLKSTTLSIPIQLTTQLLKIRYFTVILTKLIALKRIVSIFFVLCHKRTSHVCIGIFVGHTDIFWRRISDSNAIIWNWEFGSDGKYTHTHINFFDRKYFPQVLY